MDTVRKRQSALLIELPWRTPGYPGDTAEQPTRQQLGLKYVGIAFGFPESLEGGPGSYSGRIGRGILRGVWG